MEFIAAFIFPLPFLIYYSIKQVLYSVPAHRGSYGAVKCKKYFMARVVNQRTITKELFTEKAFEFADHSYYLFFMH